MYFSSTLRHNPATRCEEPYYRLKESYRDVAGAVRGRIVLSPGFITGFSGEQLKRVAAVLTYRAAHKNERELFEDSPCSDEPAVVGLIASLWQMLVSQNRIDIDRDKDRKRIEKERNLLCAGTIETMHAREIGAEWCCRQAMEQLELTSFLQKHQWTDGFIQMALSLLITRTVYHCSEYKSLRIMNETSGVCELFGFSPDVFNKHNIYDIPLKFYEIKSELEAWLSKKTNHLFNLRDSIVLFDLTNTYFEVRKENSSLARFGRSKEKRSDAKLVVLAMVVNAEGFIKHSAILEGNTSDPSTLPDMIEQLSLQSHSPANKALVVIDAGIATEENLEKITASGYDYLCVSRKKPDEKEIISTGKGTVVYDNREQPNALTALETEKCSFVRVESYSKKMKERSMNRLFKERFEQYLQSIEASIHKKEASKSTTKFASASVVPNKNIRPFKNIIK